MPRSKKHNKEIKDKRREQILFIALRLLATKGYAAATISDICSAMEISKGLFFFYFPTKESVFLELIKEAFEKLNYACRELEVMKKPPAEKIKIAITELLRGIVENEQTPLYYLLIAQATYSDATPKKTKRIIAKENTFHYEVITRIMQAGQKDGTITKHDPDELALVFWTSITGLAINRAVHGRKFKSPDPSILTNLFLND